MTLFKRKCMKKNLFKWTKRLALVGAAWFLVQNKDTWGPLAKDVGWSLILIATPILSAMSILKIKNCADSRRQYLDYLRSDIKHVDTLSGIEFERYLRAHFKSKGYRVFLTPPQHDYGVDLVITKGNDKIAVQAKRYNYEQGYKVTYKAVQEVSAGKAYYGCNKGIVITNSFFTKSARELAECNNIDMWDRTRLIKEFSAARAPCQQAYKDGYYPGTVQT